MRLMARSARIIVAGVGCLIISIIFALLLYGVASLGGCAPPRTALSAEQCRLSVDREFLPPLVATAIHNCPKGGDVSECVPAEMIATYQSALNDCRESK